jgi:RES domain-containing protein
LNTVSLADPKIVRSFRICKRKYSSSAYDGKGAFLYGGRWSSPGTRVVYTASSLSLAALEILVNLQDRDMLDEYEFIAADIELDMIQKVGEIHRLPPDWRISPSPLEIQRIGDDWARSKDSVVLEVPSSIIPQESNYLLNPEHPDFSRIRIGEPERFTLDKRLLK